jgi:hypothetical protein
MTPTLTQSRSSNGQDGNARHPSLLFSTPSLSMPPTHPQRNLQVQHHILCTTAASAESNQTPRPAYPHPRSFISRARGHPSSLRKMPVSCGPRPANLIDAMSDTQISDGASARKRRAINFGPTQQKKQHAAATASIHAVMRARAWRSSSWAQHQPAASGPQRCRPQWRGTEHARAHMVSKPSFPLSLSSPLGQDSTQHVNRVRRET